jgi:serine/threonine protein phosphatase PrpC
MDKHVLEDTIVEEDIHPQLIVAGRTDVGALRPTNQDSFFAAASAGVFVVADGMGGYSDGDVASRMVCEALFDVQQESRLDDTIASVKTRLGEVNRKLFDAATRILNPVLSGSTVVVMLARRMECAFLWAGDSRVYRLRHGQLLQMTTDHTWAAELNIQNSEEADHAITRAVGGEGTLSLDVRRERMQLGDRYLLCTDGLTHELDDARIGELLAKGTPDEAAGALIEATLDAGARDNVTVLVIDVQ